jgi:cell division protein FtsX
METNNVAVVMHINETLSADEIQSLENNLTNEEGVNTVRISERASHLLLVNYDPRQATALSLLGSIKTFGLNAQLIGGI